MVSQLSPFDRLLQLIINNYITNLLINNMPQFKVGEVVQIGPNGEKGKIIEITRPLGTYCMYKVHSMVNGQIKTCAYHELVKGLPDEDFLDLYNCFEKTSHTSIPTSTVTLEELDTINLFDLFQTNPNPMDHIVNTVQHAQLSNSTTSTTSKEQQLCPPIKSDRFVNLGVTQ